MVLTPNGQTCHSMETLLMRSESEKTNSKAQREKDVFFSAGQNTTFLAGTSRTVCPLWQYPARLDVHKCVFTCNPVWLHNLPPREFGKKDIWETLATESSLLLLSHYFQHHLEQLTTGKNTKENHLNCWSGTQPTISEMQQGCRFSLHYQLVPTNLYQAAKQLGPRSEHWTSPLG